MLPDKLPHVPLPPQGPNKKEILEIGVVLKDWSEVTLFQAEQAILSLFAGNVLVFVSDFVEIADLAEVAALLIVQDRVLAMQVVDINHSTQDKVYLFWSSVERDAASRFPSNLLEALELQRRNNHGDQFVICLETELTVLEQSDELLLEGDVHVVLHKFDLQVLRQLLIELAVGQERIGTVLKIFQGVYFPVVYGGSKNVRLDG